MPLNNLSKIDDDSLRSPEDFRSSPLHLTAIADLDDLLLAAEKKKILDIPSEDPNTAIAGEDNGVRHKTIVERLFLLGYLPSKELEAHDPKFLQGVKQFQSEAGLVSDSWAGKATWDTLHDLVSFDDATDIKPYLKEGKALNTALKRALNLRLWALGLLKNKERPSYQKSLVSPSDALNTFWQHIQRFGIVPLGASKESTLNLVTRVFDQEALLQGIAKSSTSIKDGQHQRLSFVYRKYKNESDKKLRPALGDFVACVTSIELWMLGYDIDISKGDKFPVLGFDTSHSGNSKIRKALKQFWQDLGGKHSKWKAQYSKSITPELLFALIDPSSTQTQNKEIKQEDHSEEVAKKVNTTDAIESAVSEGKNLGSRLWDGLKRIWKWIKKGINKVLDIGKNLFRAFYRYAIKAYQIVRFATKTIYTSLQQYLSGYIQQEKENPAFVHISHDGDIESYIPSNISQEEIEQTSKKIRYFAKAFNFSTKIVAILLKLLKSAVLGISNVLGWARLIWLLVKSYREIRPVYLALKNIT